MAIKVLPNETVKFSLTGQDFNTFNRDCMQDNDLWCQLAEPQVITQFEGELTPLTGDELVERNTFDGGLLSPWVVVSGTYTIPAANSVKILTFPGTTQANVRQPITLTDGKIYRLSVQVSASSNADLLLTWYGGGVYMSDYFFPTVQPGYYEMYFMADANSLGIQINVISANNTTQGYISLTSAHLVEYSTPAIAVYDCDGVFQSNITKIEYSLDKFAVSINWGELGLDKGCYRICLSDTDDLSQDLLLPSLFIIASNGSPIIASQGATNAPTVTSLTDRANIKIQPQARQENRTPMGIKAFG